MTPSVAQHARQDAVRQQVIHGVAGLLRAGEDVTFAKVAVAAGVPERTVYRHFPHRDALMAAVFAWANEQVGFAGTPPRTRHEMADMVGSVFPGFDGIAAVIDELLASSEGRRARLANVDERRAAARSVVADAAPSLDADRSLQVAAIVQVLGSAPVWQALRDFWDFDGAEAAAAVTTVVDLLLAAAAAQGP